MKPEQFIRKYGEKKARDVVAACPEYYHYYHIVEGVYYTCPKASRVAVKDLKRLLESIDQINAFDGGIKEAKEILSRINKHGSKYATLFERPALEQAIHDYESIYGGEP
ncbi:hypothetical protein [Acinetobacter baumannii]|uniref:hypothetical protein n=1 Tax=Acinetobacter baumannii TaxID=470 RepID=UPI001FF4C25F|nr:hypothetical protein [Acinetobacter baumannii]MCJ9258837.1 hypothetical protein [Acinetobacter baumannii]